MYLRLITILCMSLVLSDASLQAIGNFFGQLFGIKKCPTIADPTSTDVTRCGDKRPDKCDPSYKYRSYDGSCNNLKHPWWGTPYVPYKRLADNSYSDGVHAFPKSVDNKSLPNPRKLSLDLFSHDNNKNDILWNIAFMQYGQLIAHDLGLTADVGQTEIFVACCSKGQLTETEKKDPRCSSIIIPDSDTFNKKLGRECINFYRTQTTHDRDDCKNVSKVAEPLNAVSGYMDASYLYGSSKEENDKVREFKGGRLKSVIRDGIEYLPNVDNPTQVCAIKSKKQACFAAGDVRVNQNPELALLHNLYLLHHNIVADKLNALNPHWDDEKCFQETRKIVIAVHQNIFYNEMLLFMLGTSILVNQKVVYPGNTGYVNDYNPDVNAATSNAFSTSAYRLFHTEIKGKLKSYTEPRIENYSIQLRNWFDNPDVIVGAENYTGFTRGIATQPQGSVDSEVSVDIQNYLFKDGKGGDDLKAIDIIRGRDHGLGTYATFVEKCCLGKLETWDDALTFFKPSDVLKMKSLYSSPLDIELVVGTGLENRIPVALTGPVTACIMADQMRRTRQGDRFFYQNKGIFTKDQLKEIVNTNFGDLLCLAKGIKEMQPRAFQQISLVNPLMPCSSRRKFNYDLWKEDPKND